MKKAAELYQKAALGGNPNAKFRLANCLHFGEGVIQVKCEDQFVLLCLL